MKSIVMTGLCLLMSSDLVQAGWWFTSSEMTLVRDGKPAATIVIATNATRSAQFAAAELQYHVKKITGAELPIEEVASDKWRVTSRSGADGKTCILVGESSATLAMGLKSADFQPQEYLIRFLPDAIVLMGRDKDDRAKLDYAISATFPGFFDEQGTCYAVYDFLERCCGVRWYLPTEIGLVCPANPTLKVSCKDIRRAPVMKYRYDTGNAIPGDLCGDTIQGSTPIPNLDTREYHLWHHRQRIGGEPYAANHSLYGYYARFLETNNPAVFEKEHREYFAQGYPGKPDQMCYSSTGLIDQVAQDANAFFEGRGAKYGAHAMGDYFAVVPMDNGSWCKCPECAGKVIKTSVRAKGLFSNDIASDYLFHFINRIAGKVYTTHPDKFIAALAYADYAYPPSAEKLSPSVSIQMCLTARYVHDKKVQDNDLKILDLWGKESKDRRKFLWLYYCFPSLNALGGKWRCFPGFFAHHVVTEMATWHKAGIRGLFYEPSYIANSQKSVLFDQVESYVTWKLADDPTLDGNRLIDEFFTLYYGAAAKPMKAFYNRVEEIYCDPANYDPAAAHPHQSEAIAWDRLGTDERMAELGKLMEQARAAATTKIEKDRVALFEKGIWQYMLKGKAAYQKRVDVMKPFPVLKVNAPRVAHDAAAGNPAKIDWSKALVLDRFAGMHGEPTTRKAEVRVVHDGKYLYLQMVEFMDPRKLAAQGDIWHDDQWQFHVVRQRSDAYRQMVVNFLGKHITRDYEGGLNDWDSGAVFASDTAASDRWTLQVAIPLAKLLAGGAKPGDTLYVNFVRATGGDVPRALFWIPTFYDAGGYYDAGRLGELTLMK